MERRVVWLLAVAIVVLVAASGTVATDSTANPPADSLIAPAADGPQLWPHTSRRQSVEGRTLAINVLVDDDPAAVRRLLSDESDVDWEQANETGRTGNVSVPLPGSENVSVDTDPAGTLRVDGPGLDVTWVDAHGATRYTYVERRTGRNRWLESQYQLHAGDYLGRRHHVRAYAPASGEWTALQAHGEYWDWFRLRHTVTEMRPAQAYLESVLSSSPGVSGIERGHSPLGGPGESGITVIELAGVAVIAIRGRGRVEDARERLTAPHVTSLALAGGVCAVYLGVRAAGLGLERSVPWLHPKLVAALLYPVLAAGVPAVAYTYANETSPAKAGGLAAAGLLVAFAVDFALLGVGVPPRGLVHHRLWLAGATGVVAAAGAVASRDQGSGGAARAVRGRGTLALPSDRTGRRGRWLLTLGMVAWIVGLAVPLFGL